MTKKLITIHYITFQALGSFIYLKNELQPNGSWGPFQFKHLEFYVGTYIKSPKKVIPTA